MPFTSSCDHKETWQKRNPEWRDKFFYEHRLEHPGLPKSEALISLGYKYINYYELPDSSHEFYDLRSDPKEIRNPINISEYNGQIKEYERIPESIRLKVR